jgi:hypothetical protein
MRIVVICGICAIYVVIHDVFLLTGLFGIFYLVNKIANEYNNKSTIIENVKTNPNLIIGGAGFCIAFLVYAIRIILFHKI